MAKVSVVMPVYCRNKVDGKYGNLLVRAIDSVLSQTFSDFELILVDDASTDGTEWICRGYAAHDHRIRYFRARNNSGKAVVRYNDGMMLATADLFSFMGDDDKWESCALEALHGAISGGNSDCGMVYGAGRLVNDFRGTNKLYANPWSMERLLEDNILLNVSVMIRREAVNLVGGFDEAPVMQRFPDWDFWARIGRRCKVAFVDRMVATALEGRTDSVGGKWKFDKSSLDMLRDCGERDVRLKGLIERPPNGLDRFLRSEYSYSIQGGVVRGCE